MPARSQMKIRRDINRLNDLVKRHEATQPSLRAIGPAVASIAERVNTSWQSYQKAVVASSKERAERDTAIEKVMGWMQRWRPVVLITVPGAAANISVLPARKTTPDDVLRVAEDLKSFIEQNPGAATFRQESISDVGDAITMAQKELAEAVAAWPLEQSARDAFSVATLNANNLLVPALDIVRSIFGPTSAEYKQFIARATPQEEEQEMVDAATGETPTPPSM